MEFKTTLLIIFIHLTSIMCAPSPSPGGWVTVSSKYQTTNEEYVRRLPKIYSMRVNTNVTNRFASSLVTSKVKNSDGNPQEATFSFVLPDTAYISGFIMEVDGKKYEAYIQEKEQAKKTYNEAVSSGYAAGHVAVNARDSNKFTVSVNIMPESKAIFYLKYEELLSRQKELYDVVINLHPGQPVEDIEVQVTIKETRPLTTVTTPSLRSGNELTKNNEILDPKAVIEYMGKNSARVVFKPDLIQQKEFAKELGTKEENGFAGQFVVQYDVERDPQGGELLYEDGYFVHFFSPKDAQPEPKHISFVLDTSGSMWGRRIRQLKDAMKSIINSLHEQDSFNIIDFNSFTNVWNVSEAKVQYLGEGIDSVLHTVKTSRQDQTLPGSFDVSGPNMEKARQLVDSFIPSGATDIYLALKTALELHKKNKDKDERQPIIMFLTDGQATDGETIADVIVKKVVEENTDDIPIISISFGDGADKSFLRKLSLRNHGFSRHIYEGADAALQLKSFYEVISSPLFNKIKFKYTSENVSDVTRTDFSILFKGSELVVAGKYGKPMINPGFSPSNSMMERQLSPVVYCRFGSSTREFKPNPGKPMGSLEKHWAFLTLKQILQEREAADQKEVLTKKALDLALKYSFVTPVSSLVVVKPNETKTETNLQDASKGSSYNYQFITTYRPQAMPTRWPSAPFISHGLRGPPSDPHQYTSYGGMMPQPVMSFNRLHDENFLLFDPLLSQTISSTTSVTEQTTETIINDTIIEKMKRDMSWFGGVFNAKDGTVDLKSLGTFSIGVEGQVIKPIPECTKTPINGTGHCVLLRNCPQVHNLLNSMMSYVQFFCPLGRFAGVCCPTNITKLTV